MISKFFNAIVILCVLISFLFSKTDVFSSEYESCTTRVYDACIDSLVDSISIYSQIIINDSTVKIVGGTNREAIEVVGEENTLELHKQYSIHNAKSYYISLKKSKHKSHILYLGSVCCVLSKSSKNSRDAFWSELKFKFPKVKNIVSFSKVIFTKENKYALVYMNVASEYSHSINRLIYLMKNKKEYVIIYVK